MTPQAQLTMLVWIPILFYIFIRFPAQKAVVISFIVAWLFLPQKSSFSFPGLPDYTRLSATSYGILLATFIFDVGRFRSFKFAWIDIPMLILCVCPFASSISNGLGIYDGISSVLTQTLMWGIPYFLGRIYLNTLPGLRFLAIGVFVGGLVYVPLCLYEIRMSPQLHRMVYGYFPHSFGQTVRYGGFRPQVFMQHGLQVGAWMMVASLVGIWLWKAGVLTKLWGIPMSLLVSVLFITFVLCKSTGAYFLMVWGLVSLFSARWFRSSFIVLLSITMMFLYLYLGATGTFTGKQADQMVSWAAEITNEERASSLQTRLDAEQILGDKARQQMIFGWGGWGRHGAYNPENGRLILTSDSLWMQVFGTKGVVGLFSLYMAMLLPVASFCLLCYPAKTWFNPKVASASALAVVLVLYMYDNLFNSMENPVYMLTCGAIAGLVLKELEPKPVRRDSAVFARRSLSQQRQNRYN